MMRKDNRQTEVEKNCKWRNVIHRYCPFWLEALSGQDVGMYGS